MLSFGELGLGELRGLDVDSNTMDWLWSNSRTDSPVREGVRDAVREDVLPLLAGRVSGVGTVNVHVVARLSGMVQSHAPRTRWPYALAMALSYVSAGP